MQYFLQIYAYGAQVAAVSYTVGARAGMGKFLIFLVPRIIAVTTELVSITVMMSAGKQPWSTA